MAMSLDKVAEELTCSICLSYFTTPVTLPCAHNFCLQCLDLTWKGAEESSYSCPQCREVFSSKPELKKNTVLTNLVNQLRTVRKEDPDTPAENEDEEVEEEEDHEPQAPDMGTVLCDSCRKVAASKTCLTCMASFCQEHLQPHLTSPAFLDHLLSQPLGDLKKRKCAEHNKLMDHYCWDHGQCVCCYCAMSHKACKTYPVEEAKRQKELHYMNVLRSMNQKIEKATSTVEEVQIEQRQLLESTRKKKELLEAEYDEIKCLIDEERRKAMAKIEEEEKKVTSKFNYTQSVLTKKRHEYERLRSKVQSLLQEQDDFQFLQKATRVKDATSKEPFKPRTEFDEKLLQSIYKSAVGLKDAVKSHLCQTAETPEWRSHPKQKPPGAEPGAEPEEARKKWGRTSPAPGPPEETPPTKSNFKTKKTPNTAGTDSRKPAPHEKDPRSKPAARSPETREQLLMYAEKLSADASSVHKKIFMSDLFTKLSVSDVPQSYPECEQRFISCSQFLCSQGFSQGVHYWEIMKEGGHFSGLGVAYNNIARFGPESRLGRNKVSWCIEWCNGKLQAWHDDKQTDLTTPNTGKYGVLLNCDQGFVSFFCIGKKFSEIYKFRARFTAPVYPAFWMFSSSTVLSLNAFHLEP
ncbi:E3 ubiquitin/ISG15 ligase TRIM25-like isoform 2-T2 [Anomaloglossus baeobatrachus]|uniref:E3 ubiquitin/ISG15 ligase TRIM25-like isoform X2 n=1 Tax=Anomaloglossus baeobatrachus TaxID=238106 RepID=UPI003F4F6739